MDNSLDHRHLVLTITFVLALTGGVPGLAIAAPTANAVSGLALESHDETIKFSVPSEAPAAQGREADAANIPNMTAPSLQNFGLDPTPGVAPRMALDVPLGHEIGNSIKETLRPLHDDLSQNGILNAVRNMESELGLGNNHELKERADGDRSNGDEPRTTSWGNAGDASSTVGPHRTEAQVKEEHQQASIMLEQLIDELTPWVAAAVVVYLLVYGIKLMRAYRRAKAARRRSRNSRRSRHKRRSSRQPAGELQTPTPSSSAAEAGNQVTTADGAPP